LTSGGPERDVGVDDQALERASIAGERLQAVPGVGDERARGATPCSQDATRPSREATVCGR
jgi:hypothetical protein